MALRLPGPESKTRSGSSPLLRALHMVRKPRDLLGQASHVEETMMNRPDATAITIARAHRRAWSHHDWEKTRELLAPDVHAVGTTTQPMKASAAVTGIDASMESKIKAAQLIEPGSVQEISAIGDDRNALILVTMRIAPGSGGTMVTMARALLYLLDENKKSKEERDAYSLLSP